MVDEVSAGTLVGLLVGLLLISAFFSGSETALLTLNRYRLRHRARQGHLGAQLAERLLTRPDRLISLILIGSNVANTLATSLVTLVALRLGGPAGVATASIGFAFVIMIFTDVMPKTVGAVRSEQLGLPAAVFYYVLLNVTLPVVWLVTIFSNSLLRLFGVHADKATPQHLTLDELRTIVTDAGALLPRRRQRMLMSILELEDMTVDEIMIPDNELVGIDLHSSWDVITATITGLRIADYRYFAAVSSNWQACFMFDHWYRYCTPRWTRTPWNQCWSNRSLCLKVRPYTACWCNSIARASEQHSSWTNMATFRGW
ncbi:MAG: CNNM domain-containing protein [Gammaproteobacteria bacterium]